MLSILICSLHERAGQLNELMGRLNHQTEGFPVEILTEIDSRQMTIGAKRNLLLSKAKGVYLAFVDDDDMVSPDYVRRILAAIDSYYRKNKDYADCIGMCGTIDGASKDHWQFRHSITVDGWCKDKAAHIYFRTPNHLNPLREDHAKKCVFPSNNWGEDRAYSDQVREHLKTETFIEHPIYYYKMGNK